MTPSQPNAEFDAQRLLQDRQVHQIELEMQNEALLQLQIALQVTKQRYVDLYEFAPVGCFTLSLDGLIGEINLTAVKLLGVEHHDLLLCNFTNWVAPVDQLRRTEWAALATAVWS